METVKTKSQVLTTRDLTLSAALAAFFIVASLIPLSKFIGGAGLITLELVVVPLIAAILRPIAATITIVIGAVGMAIFQTIFQTGLFPVLGLLSLPVPIIPTILGSLAFHYRYGSIAPWAYVLTGAIFYLAYSKGGTIVWLLPYIIVIVSLPAAFYGTGTRSTTLRVLYTAMSEQVTLNILSIAVLGLVDGVWTIIAPFMFFERTVATLGGTSLIVALKSRLESRLPLSQESVGR